MACKALHNLAFSLLTSFSALLTSLWPYRSLCCYRICQIPTLMLQHLLFPLPWAFHIEIFTWLTPWPNSVTGSDTLSAAGPSLDYLKDKTSQALPLSLYIFALRITLIYCLCVYSFFFSLTREGIRGGNNSSLLFCQHLEHTQLILVECMTEWDNTLKILA